MSEPPAVTVEVSPLNLRQRRFILHEALFDEPKNLAVDDYVYVFDGDQTTLLTRVLERDGDLYETEIVQEQLWPRSHPIVIPGSWPTVVGAINIIHLHEYELPEELIGQLEVGSQVCRLRRPRALGPWRDRESRRRVRRLAPSAVARRVAQPRAPERRAELRHPSTTRAVSPTRTCGRSVSSQHQLSCCWRAVMAQACRV